MFPVGRLLQPGTWTAGSSEGGATVPEGKRISWTLGSRYCAGATSDP